MKVTVLGSSGGYPRPGRACSGYLISRQGQKLVLDMGSGALANLLKYGQPDEVGALAITHVHYDHYIDIYGLCTARRFWERELPPLEVLAPPGARSVIGAPISERSRDDFLKCLVFTDAADGALVELAGFEVEARRLEHVVPTFGFRVTAAGKAVCYSGDTDLSDSLLELAAGADLLICEATFTSESPVKAPGHLFASEAGGVATSAGAGRLLLTHVWPTLSEQRAVEDAVGEYKGTVEAAVEGLTVEV